MAETFHFLRPWWFIALIPAVIIFLYNLRHISSSGNVWEKYCDPHLLPHLISDGKNASQTWISWFVLTLWVLAILALAGPTWSMYGQPVYQKNIARVIALDVSQSMNAEDIPPSRIDRGKYKVLDLLHNIHEGQTGMIVFSSKAFVVSPLTSDTNTIASMVPVLNSAIVPVQGSNISKALLKSAKLLNQAGFTNGEIILVSDSTPNSEDVATATKLEKDGYTTSVLAIGTSQGGPVTQADGSLATDDKGNIIISNIDTAALQKLATAGNGLYTAFTNDNADISALLNQNKLGQLADKPTKELQTKSLWRDEGDYLIWVLIVLAAILARRGWLEKIC